jgi:hypothetical protein
MTMSTNYIPFSCLSFHLSHSFIRPVNILSYKELIPHASYQILHKCAYSARQSYGLTINRVFQGKKIWPGLVELVGKEIDGAGLESSWYPSKALPGAACCAYSSLCRVSGSVDWYRFKTARIMKDSQRRNHSPSRWPMSLCGPCGVWTIRASGIGSDADAGWVGPLVLGGVVSAGSVDRNATSSYDGSSVSLEGELVPAIVLLLLVDSWMGINFFSA